MHEVTVESEFCAAHALRIRGEREPTHGHNFRVRATVGALELDPDGLVCDFHALERSLGQIIGPLRDRDLNTTPPFDRINPSAERIAEHIARSLADASGALGARVRVLRVSVTEAPGCEATHRLAG